jgi:hypothetical protein
MLIIYSFNNIYKRKLTFNIRIDVFMILHLIKETRISADHKTSY